MNNYLDSFKRGFAGSLILAAAIVFAIYATMVSFVKHEGKFSFKSPHQHHQQ